MADITSLILDDHDWFRRQFARLDDLTDPAELAKVWQPLADLLDVHARAEEEIFYPHLLRRGEDAEEETLDAIGDHNDIRDGVHEAALHPVGSTAWHAAVRQARTANSEHMAEEEDDGLADFRRHADPGLREELGRRFAEFKRQHEGARDLDVSDLDPREYVEEELGDRPADASLGIGSLKEQD
ncbi:hemerythrin domain-containing protein [Amycolatopsis sp. NPDC051371]|uniref:hemerythrin domain-containing protein n=1 Tax=Amycolatopsis sp. NPDC051371 TaxID=3155800 RepID=UPI003436A488